MPDKKPEFVFDDLRQEDKIALYSDMRALTNEYEEWNCDGRQDNLIIHTDAIDDFFLWLRERINKGGK